MLIKSKGRLQSYSLLIWDNRSSATTAFSLSTLFVGSLLDFLLVCIALVLDLLLTLSDLLLILDATFFLLLSVLFVEMGETLNHSVDLFLLLVHESFLEGALRWQSEFREQVILSSLVLLSHVIEDANSLLLLER